MASNHQYSNNTPRLYNCQKHRFRSILRDKGGHLWLRNAITVRLVLSQYQVSTEVNLSVFA